MTVHMTRWPAVATMFASAILTLATANVVAAPAGSGEISYADPNVHFHPDGKPPSEHTLKVLNAARESRRHARASSLR